MRFVDFVQKRKSLEIETSHIYIGCGYEFYLRYIHLYRDG